MGDLTRSDGVATALDGVATALDGVATALDGVGAGFYIAPAFLPDEAAAKAGVRRFVFSSVIHPTIPPISLSR